MRSTVLALLTTTFAACAVPSLQLQPRYGRAEISGTAGASSGGTGGAADLEQAGLEEEEIFSGRVDLEFGSPHLVVLAQAPRFEGTGTLDVTVSDGTNTITSGTTVNSRIELGTYDAALVFDLVPGDTVEVALGLGLAYLDLDLRFEDAGTGTTVASEQAVPVPLAAGSAAVRMGPLEVGAFAGAVEYQYEDDSLSYVDADVFARFSFLGGDERLRGSLVLGYRLTDVELEYDDDAADVEADFSVRGPYAGLELSL